MRGMSRISCIKHSPLVTSGQRCDGLVPVKKQRNAYFKEHIELYLKWRILFYHIRILGWCHEPGFCPSSCAVLFGILMNRGSLLFTRSPEETPHLKRKDLRQMKKYIFWSTKKSTNTVISVRPSKTFLESENYILLLSNFTRNSYKLSQLPDYIPIFHLNTTNNRAKEVCTNPPQSALHNM